MTPSYSQDAANELRKPTEHRQHEWRGIRMCILYVPNKYGLAGTAYQFDALEVRTEQGSPLPFTETGYRSVHPTAGSIAEAGGHVAYVQRWLEQTAASEAWKLTEAGLRQGSLF